MIKKISEKDKKDWLNFINKKEKLTDKEISEKKKKLFNKEKTIDLHGYTLEEANNKIFEYIENCYLNNVDKINIITGKGLRSKNLDDPYQSNDLSILKYSVPNFIKNNTELMDKILKIDFDSVNSPSKGNFDIILRSKKSGTK